MSLMKLQQAFFNDIKSHDCLDVNYILPGENLSSSQRLGLYQDAYHIRLFDALSENYPALHAIAGDEIFGKIFNQYLEKYPSRHFSIRYFGDQLPAFIQKEITFNDVELLSEIALFEWALGTAFDGDDAEILSRDDMQDLAPELWPHYSFKLVPTFNILPLNWNVPDLWKAATQKQAPDEPVKLDCPVSWIVWRPDFQSQFRSVDRDEAEALAKLQCSENFAEFCESIDAQKHEKPEEVAIAYIIRWLGEGLFAKV